MMNCLQKIILFSLPLLFLLCVQEYNPYADPSNAAIVIDVPTFDFQQPVPLFCAETLTVKLAFKELIKSLQVTIENNRLWHDTTIQSDQFRQCHRFIFSCSDTGRHDIVMKINLNDGTRKDKKISFRCVNPLFQDSVFGLGAYGDSVAVKTRPVHDVDAEYCWQFDQTLCRSFTPQNKFWISHFEKLENMGMLWVQDSAGHRSSPVAFYYVLKDKRPPVITSATENFILADTIIAHTPIFSFKVNIEDKTPNNLDFVSINGKPFDFQNGPIFTKLYDSMTLYKKIPLEATVYARDKKQNDTTKKFILFYNDSIPQKDTVLLGIGSITQTNIISNSTELFLIGTAESSPPFHYTLKFFNNGVHLIDQDTALYYRDIWGCRLHILENSINDFAVCAFSSNQDTVGKLKVSIIHNTNFSDTTGPILSRMYVNNASYEKGMIVENAGAAITILAFDPGSGIKKVLVNGAEALPKDNKMITWQSVASLLHGVNKIPLVLYDNNNNNTRDTLEIICNRKPSVLSDPSLPYYLMANRIYYDTVDVLDPDGDSIVINLQTVIPHLAVSSVQSGIAAKIFMRWAPQIDDTGVATIQLTLYDGLQYSPRYTWTYCIKKDSSIVTPVAFLTTSNALTKVFIVDSASRTDTLRIIPGTGTAPFLFNARLYPEDTVLLHDVSSPCFSWKPAQKDTGSHLILFTVHDKALTADSLFHAIRVYNKNNGTCTLTVKDISGKNLLSGNTVTLLTTADTAKLRFTIIDHDNPFEQYTVKQTVGSATTIMQTDSNWFIIAILPKMSAFPETLTVTVFDKTGGSTMNQKKIFIKYPQNSNPNDITNLFLWLKADNDTSVHITALNDWVTFWSSSDKSGRYVESYAYAPTYMKTANPKYIQFNRSRSDFLYSASITFTTTVYTILVVAQNKSLTSNSREAIVSLIDNNNYGFGFGLKGASLNSYFADNMNTFSDLPSDSLIITANKWCIFTYTFASTSSSATVDQRCNGKTGAFNTINHYLPVPVRIMIGGYGQNSQPINSSNADIAEVIIYNRKLTIQEIQKVELYLSNKFGIPLQ